MKKLLFVFNPHSGTGEIVKHLAKTLDIFTKAGYEVVAYPTQKSKDGMRKIMEDGARFDRIVVAGGDGMLHELVNAVMTLPNAVDVGYIPTGTVNDFANSNKIPRNNVITAANVAASDNVRDLDLGNFNGEYFSYVAAFGLATNIAYDTNQKLKNTWGFMAYLANAASTFDYAYFNDSCRHMKIRTDSGIFEGEFVFGAVSNSLSIAGVSNLISKDVVLDDGLLEGIFIKRPQSIFDFNDIQSALFFRDFDKDSIIYVKSSEFEIESDAVSWTLDGENGGEHEYMKITAANKALHIALPKEEAEAISLPSLWDM